MSTEKLSNEEETPALNKIAVTSSADMEDDYYDEEWEEMQPCETCPKCGRGYDHIDYDFQACSKCGWDEENKKWDKKREPTDDDYLAGEADILTGRWF